MLITQLFRLSLISSKLDDGLCQANKGLKKNSDMAFIRGTLLFPLFYATCSFRIFLHNPRIGRGEPNWSIFRLRQSCLQSNVIVWVLSYLWVHNLMGCFFPNSEYVLALTYFLSGQVHPLLDLPHSINCLSGREFSDAYVNKPQHLDLLWIIY